MPYVRAVDGRPGETEGVGVAKLGQKDLVQPVTYTNLGPLGQGRVGEVWPKALMEDSMRQGRTIPCRGQNP